jgi:hypothetical protein
MLWKGTSQPEDKGELNIAQRPTATLINESFTVPSMQINFLNIYKFNVVLWYVNFEWGFGNGTGREKSHLNRALQTSF